MQVILNIGLARDGKSNIGPGTALREIAAAGLKLNSYSIHHSDTELTVVADVSYAFPMFSAVHSLAVVLGQDCIACYQPDTGNGQLIGPRSDAWGAFNPEFFLLPDGSTLQTAAVAA